ncbi:MAG: AraC family transcriptional regulator ligand-binding domain-containing protein [Bacteroidota bacterium]
MNFIAITLYHKVLNHALREGMSLEATAIPAIPQPPAKGPHVVPADTFFELHEIVDKALEPGFAVRVGQVMEMDDYGVLGMSWKTCSMAREIFERSERYFSLLTNTYVFKMEDAGGFSKIYLYREAYRRGVALSNEATFSATVKVLQMMTQTAIGPVSVSFRHDPPRDLKSHHACFNCPVHFNQDANFLCYKTADLNTPTAKADLSINKFLLERIEEEAKGIQVNPNKLVGEVKNLIKNALPSGIPSKEKIGRQLGMSNRTLTRRLSETGLTFRALIERTQQEISKDLLSHSSQSVSEIAFQAGFSEQSAFNRAFKRWTGKSPTTFRQN